MDWIAWTGLEWLYDEIEERFGVAAAWLVTIVVAGGIVAAVFKLGTLIL
jgi:hypothetical protein